MAPDFSPKLKPPKEVDPPVVEKRLPVAAAEVVLVVVAGFPNNPPAGGLPVLPPNIGGVDAPEVEFDAAADPNIGFEAVVDCWPKGEEEAGVEPKRPLEVVWPGFDDPLAGVDDEPPPAEPKLNPEAMASYCESEV